MVGVLRSFRRSALALSVAAVAIVCLAQVASAGGPGNGDFETGDLTGWTTADQGPSISGWVVYQGGDAVQTDVPGMMAPPQGRYAAAVDQSGPGAHVLYRTLKIPNGKPTQVSFQLFFNNYAGIFCDGNSLDWTEPCNQQYRVDILRQGADPFSTDSGDVLKNLFLTRPGDSFKKKPRRMRFSLADFAGMQVVLRFAEVDNQFYFHAGVDDVKLSNGG